MQQVAADPEVRCVVLTGSGRAFCVGQDLKEHLAGLRGDTSVPLSDTVEKHYNPTVLALATMPKPVVAAVNGVAAGAGASLAFAADFRVLADSAAFNTSFAGVALSCDTGASWTLPRLVGRGKAMELLYFPRTVPAAEALELGLATQVVPADELAATVRELAARLAAGPDRRLRLHPPGGGALLVALLRGVARLRGGEDGPHRRHRGPPRRRRRVHGEGEAHLPRALTGHFRITG